MDILKNNNNVYSYYYLSMYGSTVLLLDLGRSFFQLLKPVHSL
jgi:hypothetical protein